MKKLLALVALVCMLVGCKQESVNNKWLRKGFEYVIEADTDLHLKTAEAFRVVQDKKSPIDTPLRINGKPVKLLPPEFEYGKLDWRWERNPYGPYIFYSIYFKPRGIVRVDIILVDSGHMFVMDFKDDKVIAFSHGRI